MNATARSGNSNARGLVLTIDLAAWCWARIDGSQVIQCPALDQDGQPCFVLLAEVASTYVADYASVIARPTNRIGEFDGLKARVWIASAAAGRTLRLPVHRVAVPAERNCSAFESQLTEQHAPASWVS